MDSYIPKPFSTQQLITGIAQVLNIKLKIKNEGHPKSQVTSIYKVTDLAFLDKFCEGDKIRRSKYIGMFTASAPELIKKINQAFENHDFEEIANQVHGFKTKWIMMGMTETKDLAIKLEHQCRDGSDEAEIRNIIKLLIFNVEKSLLELGM